MAPPLLTEHRILGSVIRRPTRQRFLMCRPEFFDVVYSINPWMRPSEPIDRDRAVRQWDHLVQVFGDLGHDVETIDPVPGLPDMVFAANSALVLDGIALTSRFRFAERRGEESPYREWFASHGFDVRTAEEVSEGEGDFAVAGRRLLAGWGVRTAADALPEAQELFGRPVVGLRLVDPRYYHLDTALTVLADDLIAYYPDAFSPSSRKALARLFPDAVLAGGADAAAFGLNTVSDGYHVVLPAQAEALAAKIAARGFEPVPVDMSELAKAGGSVKCCTLVLRGER